MLSRASMLAVVLAVLAACALTWQVQAWRHGREMALRESEYAGERARLAQASTAQLEEERQRRHALEQRVQSADQLHSRELSDAQQTQARLRDRLATADLRLSVLLASDADTPDMPAATGAGSVVHDAPRARLDQAHARRIVAITGDGDEGLIALRACQAYVRALAF